MRYTSNVDTFRAVEALSPDAARRLALVCSVLLCSQSEDAAGREQLMGAVRLEARLSGQSLWSWFEGRQFASWRDDAGELCQLSALQEEAITYLDELEAQAEAVRALVQSC